VDVRIGVTYSPKEIDLEMGDDIDRSNLKLEIEEALADQTRVLWLTDRRGRQVAIPSNKVAYIEIGSPDEAHRIGFGAT
jgi:Protein of unknown function (DUF3107)